MKVLVFANILITYPEHNKPFHIYPGYSYCQMDACNLNKSLPVE